MNLDDIMLRVVEWEWYHGDVMKSGCTGGMVGGERVK